MFALVRLTRLMIPLVAAWGLQADVRLNPPGHGDARTRLEWTDGNGPFVVESSDDLRTWTEPAEPRADRALDLPAHGEARYYRVRDLDPEGRLGPLFGLLQTEQSEFGTLFAKHRLKTRLWLHRSDDPVHSGGTYPPVEFWRRLWVLFQRREGDAIRTWTGRLEDLGTVSTPTARRLEIRWQQPVGSSLGNCTLGIDFPYDLGTARSAPPHASDPSYRLECRHGIPQPEWIGTGNRLGTTPSDSVALIELAPENPAAPENQFRVRRYSVRRNGARIDLHFFEGMPLYQGEVPWILKTFPFSHWLAPTTGGGGPLPTFSTDSHYARTVQPGHHNFYQEVLIDPFLDPALSDAQRRQFEAQGVRWIYTFRDLAGISFGGEAEDIRFIGPDGVIRLPGNPPSN